MRQRAGIAGALVAGCTADAMGGDRGPPRGDLVVWPDRADGASSTGDTGAPPTGCAARPTVVPGTGADVFQPLDAYDPVRLTHGPQGGWHVDTAGLVTSSAREVAVAPSLFATGLGLQVAGDQQPLYLALADYDDATCGGRFWGVRAFVDDQSPPPGGMSPQEFVCSLDGQPMALTVRVTDLVDGAQAEATVPVVGWIDPVDAAGCPP